MPKARRERERRVGIGRLAVRREPRPAELFAGRRLDALDFVLERFRRSRGRSARRCARGRSADRWMHRPRPCRPRRAPCGTPGRRAWCRQAPPWPTSADVLPPSAALMNGSSGPSSSSDCCRLSASTAMSISGYCGAGESRPSFSDSSCASWKPSRRSASGFAISCRVAHDREGQCRPGSIRAARGTGTACRAARARTCARAMSSQADPYAAFHSALASMPRAELLLVAAASSRRSRIGEAARFAGQRLQRVLEAEDEVGGLARLLGAARGVGRAARARRRSIVASEIG